MNDFDLLKFLDNSNRRYKFWEQSEDDPDLFYDEDGELTTEAVTAEQASVLTFNAGYTHCFLTDYGRPEDYDYPGSVWFDNITT